MSDDRHLTSRAVLKPLTSADESVVDDLLARLTTYSLVVDGVQKVQGGARRLLDARPPGMPVSSKHVFAIMLDGKPVGLIDLIDGFPQVGTCFIGLLAIAEDLHGRGLARCGFALLETFARERLRSTILRLAVVSSNPVMGFWQRMGFSETGEVRSYQGEAFTSEAHMMEKKLLPG